LVSNGIYESTGPRKSDLRDGCKRGILRVDAPICEYFAGEDGRNRRFGISERIGLRQGSTSITKFISIYFDACCFQYLGMVDGKTALDSDCEN
jgi:hypothetical protein